MRNLKYIVFKHIDGAHVDSSGTKGNDMDTWMKEMHEEMAVVMNEVSLFPAEMNAVKPVLDYEKKMGNFTWKQGVFSDGGRENKMLLSTMLNLMIKR